MEAATPACGRLSVAEAKQQSPAAFTPSSTQASRACPDLTRPSLAFANLVRKYLAPPAIGFAAAGHARQTPACTTCPGSTLDRQDVPLHLWRLGPLVVATHVCDPLDLRTWKGWGRRIQRPDQRCRPTQRRWRARSGVVLLRGDASLLEAGVVEASPHRQHGTLRRLSYQRSIRHRVSASFASQRACQVIIRRLRAKPDTFCIFRRLCGRNARGRALGQDRTSWRPMSAS